MAAIPVTIKGSILTKSPKSGEVDPSGIQECVIQGSLSLTGLEIGGGPIIPPDSPPDVVPPDPVEPPDPAKNWEAKTFWTPEDGWQVVLVPAGDQPIPTPSKKR